MSARPSPPTPAGRVVLHRLALDAARRAILEEAGIEVVRSRSVNRTCVAVDEAPGPCVVVVDMTLGSNAPERIAAAVNEARERRGDDFPELIGASERRAGGLTDRGRRLGLKQIFLFPEGTFTHILRRLATGPAFGFRRIAERADLHQDFEIEHEGGGLSGALENISSSGLRFVTDQRLELGTELSFAFTEEEGSGEALLVGRVVRCEPAGDKEGYRVGLQLGSMPRTLHRKLSRFVHRLNTIRVGTTSRPSKPRKATVRVRAQAVGRRRVDYFELDGTLEAGGLLVPRRPFSPGYEVGDRLELRPTRASADLKTYVVTGEERIDGDRLDARVVWRIEPAP